MDFQSTQKTTENVGNGNSKKCRSFDLDLCIHCNTFKIRFGPRIRRPTRRCMQARSHTEHAAAKRGHQRVFFWSEKKGGSSAPSEPPLATCLDVTNLWLLARHARWRTKGKARSREDERAVSLRVFRGNTWTVTAFADDNWQNHRCNCTCYMSTTSAEKSLIRTAGKLSHYTQPPLDAKNLFSGRIGWADSSSTFASGSHVSSSWPIHLTRNWCLPLCCRSERISSTKHRSFPSKSKIGSGGFSRLPLREVSSTKCRTAATLKTGSALQTTGSCTCTVAKFGTSIILKGPSHRGANLAHGWSHEVSVDKKSWWTKSPEVHFSNLECDIFTTAVSISNLIIERLSDAVLSNLKWLTLPREPFHTSTLLDLLTV